MIFLDVAPLIRSSLIAATLALAGCTHVTLPVCSSPPKARGEIQQTVNAFFDALRKEDKEGFLRSTTGTFYSFDVGKRYVGTELMEAVRDAHARGVQLNWSIGPLDTKIGCNVAWSAWENTGSVGVPPAVSPVRWLESAVLVRQDGVWKIDFFHSQRAVP